MKLIAPVLTAAVLAFSSVSAFSASDTAPKVAKPDLAKGEASYTAVCVACHNADGNASIPLNPKLAQQHPEYLVKQLQEFKTGKRKDAVMAGMVANLSDADMRNMSYWLSTKPAKLGFAKDKDAVALGERIYRGGIAVRQIAACASCHSPNGAGVPAQYPRLSGQNADYVVKTMHDFRDGKRANSIQMTGVTSKMNDKEIKAVADYIAGLR